MKELTKKEIDNYTKHRIPQINQIKRKELMNNYKHEIDELLEVNNEIHEKIFEEEAKKENTNQEVINQLLNTMHINILHIDELQNLREGDREEKEEKEEKITNIKHEEIHTLKLLNDIYAENIKKGILRSNDIKQLQELILLNLKRIDKLQKEKV